jgi:hypothetical protein
LRGKEAGCLERRFVAALDILGFEIVEVRVENPGRQHGVGGLIAHFQEAAGGNTLHAQAAQKGSDFRWALLVGKRACGDGFRLNTAGREFRIRGEAGVADRLQRQGFAGEHLGLGLDVVVEIHHGIVGIGALKRKNVVVLPIDLNGGLGDIDGARAKRGDADDGHHGQQERQDQPLVLAKNQQVVVKVRLAGG